MDRAHKLMAGGLAGVALLLSAGVALAHPGEATGAVNVRSGPGPAYPIVAGLVRGEAVNIATCTGAWCEVTAPVRGWVAAGYLVSARYVPAPVYTYPPDAYDNFAPDDFASSDTGPLFASRGFHHHPGGDHHHQSGGGHQGSAGNGGHQGMGGNGGPHWSGGGSGSQGGSSDGHRGGSGGGQPFYPMTGGGGGGGAAHNHH